MTDDTTNERHMANLDGLIDDLPSYEGASVRWARDQVVELRRERDDACEALAMSQRCLALYEALETGVASGDFTELRELLGVGDAIK